MPDGESYKSKPKSLFIHILLLKITSPSEPGSAEDVTIMPHWVNGSPTLMT